MNLTWKETNAADAGGAATGTWTTQVRVVNQANGRVVVDQPVILSGNNLSVGGSVDRMLAFTLPDGNPGVGNYLVTITVDASGSIAEGNPSDTGESNNVATTNFSVSLSPYPELAVSSLTIPAQVKLLEPFNASWTVVNSGNAALQTTLSDRLYLSRDDKYDPNDWLWVRFQRVEDSVGGRRRSVRSNDQSQPRFERRLSRQRVLPRRPNRRSQSAV